GARQLAVAGIALGVVAFWLALPPLHYRAVAVPILVGLLAIAAGLAAVALGERRAGWGAVTAGVLGIVGGALLTRAPVPHPAAIPDLKFSWLGHIPPHGLGRFLDDALGGLNFLVWVSFAVLIVSYIVMFKTPVGLRIRSVGEHPRAADTVGISVYGIRYAAVT